MEEVVRTALNEDKPFEKWEPNRIAEVEHFVRERFCDYGGTIYIDGYKIEMRRAR